MFQQLLALMVPLVMKIIQEYRDAHDGQDPTPEEVQQTFDMHAATIVADIEAWKAAHPE